MDWNFINKWFRLNFFNLYMGPFIFAGAILYNQQWTVFETGLNQVWWLCAWGFLIVEGLKCLFKMLDFKQVKAVD